MTSQSRKGSSKETQCLSNKTIQNLQSQTPYQSDNVLRVQTACAIPGDANLAPLLTWLWVFNEQSSQSLPFTEALWISVTSVHPFIEAGTTEETLRTGPCHLRWCPRYWQMDAYQVHHGNWCLEPFTLFCSYIIQTTKNFGRREINFCAGLWGAVTGTPITESSREKVTRFREWAAFVLFVDENKLFNHQSKGKRWHAWPNVLAPRHLQLDKPCTSKIGGWNTF